MGVFGDELTQEDNVLLRDDAATVAIRDRHMGTVCQSPIWNASGFSCFELRRSRGATPARLPLPDCRRQGATGPDVHAALAPAPRPWATNESGLWTSASWPAKTLARHRQGV